MLLKDKIAIVYGGGGVIGGETARTFAREGATVYLAGRTKAKLDAVAKEIVAAGGVAKVAVVDALDEKALAAHADAVAAEAGRIDIAFNAIGVVHVQGTPLAELSYEDYEHPIRTYTRTHFLSAKAVARHMVAKKSGVILTLSTPAATIGFAGVLGFGTACAAIEGLTRHLAADLGQHGIRVVGLRPDALPETVARGSHAREVFSAVAAKMGMTLEQIFAGPSPALLKRAPKVAEIAGAAAFAASDYAGAMTATTLNLTCGSAVGSGG